MSYNSTHFTSLAHTKLRNVTAGKLYNTYNQLKASHRGLQQLKKKKDCFYSFPISAAYGHTTSQV